MKSLFMFLLGIVAGIMLNEYRHQNIPRLNGESRTAVQPHSEEPGSMPTTSDFSNIDRAVAEMVAQQYRPHITYWSDEYGIDTNLVKAVICTESDGRPNVVSVTGAVGLMQLDTATAKGLLPGIDLEKLKEANTNIMLGTYYLSKIRNDFRQKGFFFDSGSLLISALCSAYNAGPTLTRRLMHPVDFKIETIKYIAEVKAYMSYYEHKRLDQLSAGLLAARKPSHYQ